MIKPQRVRRAATSANRRVLAQTKDLIRGSLDRAESLYVVERSLSTALRFRARRAGADEALLSRAASPHLDGLRSRLAVYRLINKIAAGDISRLPQLFRKVDFELPEAERWSIYRLASFPVDGVSATSDSRTLTTVLGPSIMAEFDATGESTLLEWLVREKRFELDDPGFRELITYRCERALKTRLNTELESAAEPSTPSWAALEALASARDSEIDVFPAGSTLLALHQGLPRFPEPVLEFGTTSDLADLEPQLWARGAVTLHRTERLLRVWFPRTGATANVFRYHLIDGRFAHGEDTYTRWHSRFELTALSRDDHRFNVPSDVERYLDERFGNWQTPTLFFDQVFNAPNTTPNQTLESLLYLYRRSKDAFAEGARFYADAASERMRDTFGIDYSMYVPQPVHAKVLSAPFQPVTAAGREVVVVASGFHRIAAPEIELLERVRSDDRYLVAAVHDDGGTDIHDRLARVKTLRAVDHVALFRSGLELEGVCTGVGALTAYIESHVSVSLDEGTKVDVIRLDDSVEAAQP